MCFIFADAYWGVVFGKQTDSWGNTLLDYIINSLKLSKMKRPNKGPLSFWRE